MSAKERCYSRTALDTDVQFRSTYVTQQLDASRATINMVHNNVSLTVSQDEAAKVDDEAKRRLLGSKKLSLVVDLDQTIIHATVDPTVAEWQQDEENPNHNAVKDVRAFLLKDEGPGSKGSCWYYIKLRPGLKEFLENVARLYELHIYTMGTRQYAKNIAEIIDPAHKIFGDRILSRDESGSMTAKNLQRLFPVDTKMVVIIDDRGDVWQWSPNLIKVTPYDFFVGIGDINSSFLPKKPALRTSLKAVTAATPQPNDASTEPAKKGEADFKTNGIELTNANGVVDSPVDIRTSPLEQLVAMSGSDDSAIREAQTSNQTATLNVQMEERPLAQKQKQLEAEEIAAEANATKEGATDTNTSSASSDDGSDGDRPKHNLLQDHDRELYHLEDSLRSVHTAFFQAYSQQMNAAKGGRVAKLMGGQKITPTEKTDLDLIPDIKTILPAVKFKVLGGTVIVFSGIVPLGMDVASADIAILARSFGARVDEDVNRSSTHVVAARNRTQKVRAAVRRGRGRIKIVSPQWLLESISSWQKQDEQPYLLDVEEGKNFPTEDDDILSLSESDASESEEISETGSLNFLHGKLTRPSLSLAIKSPANTGEDEESDLEGIAPSEANVDDKSPVGGTSEDWSAMHDELADFLGSDVDEDEDEEDNEDDDEGLDGGNESEASVRSKISIRGTKRARAREGDDSDSGSDNGTRRGSKKQARGPTLPTSLSQGNFAEQGEDEDEDEDEDRDEDEVEHEEGHKKEDGVVGHGDSAAKEGEGWSDFEDEDFEAELERAGSEDRPEEGDG